MDDVERAKAVFFAGLDCFDGKDYAGAEARFREALALVPGRPSVLANLATAVLRQGRPDEALRCAEQALAADAANATALAAAATATRALGRPEAALAFFDRLLPDADAAIWAERGDVLAALARWSEALASYDRALALAPDQPVVLANRGNVLRQLGRADDALASYDRALAVSPDLVAALSSRGLVRQEAGRLEEALADCERALALSPDDPDVLANSAVALRRLRRYDAALARLDRALVLRPDYPEALNSRGVVLDQLRRPEEALASFDRALAQRPDFVDALYNRGMALKHLKRLDEALASFEQVRALRPDHPHALNGTAGCVQHLAAWDRLPEIARAVEEHVRDKTSIIDPFTFLGYSGDPALQRRCATTYAEHEVPVTPPALWRGERWRNPRIRVAYLSADFHNHATSHLMAELFELHDKSRFEIIGVSYGRDDTGPMRQRLVAAFDQFHDVRQRTDAAVAAFLHDLKVDVAVDLKGYTEDARPAILAHRPAPIQVSYLGYPGTMGADFIDYVLADEVTAPFSSQPLFSERIVHLPGSYQVNDSRRLIAEATPSRADCGLPDAGFVFCCFNNRWKITPDIFAVWAELVQAVPGSVLWLLHGNDGHARNLRRHAAGLGLDPARLVFAPRQPLDAHLARHRRADLFLDTLPYNAHTTTSDALWAGLPVVTCRGTAFAGRVAASLLGAVGLPELVTETLADYRALALALARDPDRLAAVRAKLARNRETAPLFDARRFARHLEAAYTTMWERWQRGEPPAAFVVPPLAAPAP